jgi:hypothetical protein
MIEAKNLSRVLQSCASIALIAVVLFKFWSDARLDAFRQRMFQLRDELFDYAADGSISFDDPAYRLLRQSMNGAIRYAHHLTFFRVCVTMIEIQLAVYVPKRDWSQDWQLALKRLPSDDARNRLEAFHSRAMQLMVGRLVAGSPALLGLVVGSVPILILRMGWLNLKTILNRAPMFTVSHVVDTRILENEAAAAAIA